MYGVLHWLHNMFGVNPMVQQFVVKVVWPVKVNMDGSGY